MRLQEQAIICGVKIKWSYGVSIRKGSHTSSVCCNLSFSFQWLGSRSGCTWFPLPLMGSLCASTQPLANGTKEKKCHQVLWHKLHFSVILVSAGQALVSFCNIPQVEDTSARSCSFWPPIHWSISTGELQRLYSLTLSGKTLHLLPVFTSSTHTPDIEV